jgi:hypothetical protein
MLTFLGPTVQKVLWFAKEFKVQGFQSSNGWLDSFKEIKLI